MKSHLSMITDNMNWGNRSGYSNLLLTNWGNRSCYCFGQAFLWAALIEQTVATNFLSMAGFGPEKTKIFEYTSNIVHSITSSH
jgi:hypothetical protein